MDNQPLGVADSVEYRFSVIVTERLSDTPTDVLRRSRELADILQEGVPKSCDVNMSVSSASVYEGRDR